MVVSLLLSGSLAKVGKGVPKAMLPVETTGVSSSVMVRVWVMEAGALPQAVGKPLPPVSVKVMVSPVVSASSLMVTVMSWLL